MKLSRASTRVSRATSASHRCEPMKPAPPETTALGLFAANAAIRETQASHEPRVVDVAAIDDDGVAHQLLDPRHVQLPELVPFRDEDERVSTGGHRIRVLQILDLRKQDPGSLDRRRVIGTDLGARREQDLRDVDARRLAHVVGVGLEGEAEETDDTSWELVEALT